MSRLKILVKYQFHSMRLDVFLSRVAPALHHAALSKLVRRKEIEVVNASSSGDTLQDASTPLQRTRAELGTRVQAGQVVELPAFCRHFLSEQGLQLSNAAELDNVLGSAREHLSSSDASKSSDSSPQGAERKQNGSMNQMSFEPSIPRETMKAAKRFTEWIIYEDRDVIAINKPNGILVQGPDSARGKTSASGTVHLTIDDYLEALYRTGSSRPALPDSARGPGLESIVLEEKPKLVHRLDAECSGILLLAKNRLAAVALTEAFRSGSAHAVENGGDIARLAKAGPTPVSLLARLSSDQHRITKVYWASVFPPPDWTGIRNKSSLHHYVHCCEDDTAELWRLIDETCQLFCSTGESVIANRQDSRDATAALTDIKRALQSYNSVLVNLPLLQRNPSADQDFYSVTSPEARARLLFPHGFRKVHNFSANTIDSVSNWPYPTLNPSVRPDSNIVSELFQAQFLLSSVTLASELPFVSGPQMASLRSTELRSKSPDKTKLAHSTPVQIPPLRGALLALSPLTGRKHQLRLHCAAALRAPIIGDSKYSTRRPGLLANYSELKSILKQHLELHAKQTEKGSQFRPVPNLESIFSTLHLHSRAVSLLLPTQLDNPRGETPMTCWASSGASYGLRCSTGSI